MKVLTSNVMLGKKFNSCLLLQLQPNLTQSTEFPNQSYTMLNKCDETQHLNHRCVSNTVRTSIKSNLSFSDYYLEQYNTKY